MLGIPALLTVTSQADGSPEMQIFFFEVLSVQKTFKSLNLLATMCIRSTMFGRQLT